MLKINEIKDNYIRIRLSTSNKDKITEYAARDNQTMTDYIMKCINNYEEED